MFKNLFNPESDLMQFLSRMTDCIFLSMFWILGCIPVVTIGASTAALYDSAFRGIRKGDKHSWERFLEVFKGNWKAGILPTLAFLVLGYVDLKILIGFWNAAVAGGSWMAFSAAAMLCAAVLGVLSVLFPMLSRFENPTGVLFKNTLLLALANLPRALVLGMLNGLTALLCARFIFPLFFLPALAAFLGSFCIEPMFAPYMPEEEAEEETVEEE